MKLRKETAAGAAFCIVNGILSMNCFAYHFVKDRAFSSEKASERKFSVPERSKEAMKTPWIESGSVSRIFFPFEDGTLLCTDLKPDRFDVFLSEAGREKCTADKNAETAETEFIHFPGSFPISSFYVDEKLKVLYSPDDRENLLMLAFRKKTVSVFKWGKKTSYRLQKISESASEENLNYFEKSYTVIILMDDKNKEVYGIVPKKSVLKQSSFIYAAHLSSKTEKSTSLWRILQPPAYLFDVVTFPIQFIGGWLYFIIFGFKK